MCTEAKTEVPILKVSIQEQKGFGAVSYQYPLSIEEDSYSITKTILHGNVDSSGEDFCEIFLCTQVKYVCQELEVQNSGIGGKYSNID